MQRTEFELMRQVLQEDIAWLQAFYSARQKEWDALPSTPKEPAADKCIEPQNSKISPLSDTAAVQISKQSVPASSQKKYIQHATGHDEVANSDLCVRPSKKSRVAAAFPGCFRFPSPASGTVPIFREFGFKKPQPRQKVRAETSCVDGSANPHEN